MYIMSEWLGRIYDTIPDWDEYIRATERGYYLSDSGDKTSLNADFWRGYWARMKKWLVLAKDYDQPQLPEDARDRVESIKIWESRLVKLEKEHPEVLKPKAEKLQPTIVNNYYLGTAAPQAEAPDAEPPKTKGAAQETPAVTPAALELRKKFKGTVVDENGGKNRYIVCSPRHTHETSICGAALFVKRFRGEKARCRRQTPQPKTS